jgi:hypothetical protein
LRNQARKPAAGKSEHGGIEALRTLLAKQAIQESELK